MKGQSIVGLPSIVNGLIFQDDNNFADFSPLCGTPQSGPYLFVPFFPQSVPTLAPLGIAILCVAGIGGQPSSPPRPIQSFPLLLIE